MYSFMHYMYIYGIEHFGESTILLAATVRGFQLDVWRLQAHLYVWIAGGRLIRFPCRGVEEFRSM